MPVSGVLNWFGGVELARRLHLLMEPVVPRTILAHILGALYQQLWLKSGVLTRMLRPERQSFPAGPMAGRSMSGNCIERERRQT